MNKDTLNKYVHKELSLAEIISRNIDAAKILHINGIPFYCNPKQTLIEAATKNNIPIEIILSQLEKEFKNNKDEKDLTKKDLIGLINYIINEHHNFTKNALKELNLAVGQFQMQGINSNLEMMIDQFTNEMNSHMQKEERILFPLIKYLCDTEKFNEKPKSRNYGTVKNPISQMIAEHSTSIDLIKKIKSSLFTFFDYKRNNAIENFVTLLDNFQLNLYTHIHLENNVLFPKAIDLELQLTNTIRR